MKEVPTYVLPFPMRIGSPRLDEWYILPAGTRLYYDRSMPEGFHRCHVYINVEGVDLGVPEIVDANYIAPLSAYPIADEDILALLKSYPVSKQDVIRILNANPLSAEDAREVIDFLEGYSADSGSDDH